MDVADARVAPRVRDQDGAQLLRAVLWAVLARSPFTRADVAEAKLLCAAAVDQAREEARAAGALFGEKLILNEFVAFSNLNEYLAGMSDRTRAITTFALCGFANLSSIAILLGGLGSLVPEKKDLIARFGIKAVAAGSLSNLMSAALAGLMLPA